MCMLARSVPIRRMDRPLMAGGKILLSNFGGSRPITTSTHQVMSVVPMSCT